jgi:ubiquinone/menaquinone biosynthesis C-methylase UbiE
MFVKPASGVERPIGMRTIRRRRFVPPFVLTATLVIAFVTVRADQSAQQNAADAEWLVKVLDIRPGHTVGEIGAGGGELSVAMANAVGDSGRVLSNELSAKSLASLKKRFADEGLQRITVVEGRAADTNFPAECCDAIFMRSVYHHFADPAAMNASLFKSLKPGGRLAVIDFTPPGEEAASPAGRAGDNFHGVKPATVERELKAAGFEVISSEQVNRAVKVVARRPS